MYDKAAKANQQHWERMVKEGCGYTIPWLDLDIALLRQYAAGEVAFLLEPLTCMFPPSILVDVASKDVLCLASGGGQQSAVFGLLGARVTVVDLVEGQIEGDRKAAAHYGYEIAAFQADMRNLSCLDDSTFDLVYQANSIGYVPDVRQVYAEVARVLRPNGRYRVVHGNPATAFISWDGQAYCISKPYAERLNRREGAIDFRHYMDDIFNGLLDVGLSIQRVYEAPYHCMGDPKAKPGSWDHERAYVAGEFAIVARKGK